MTGHFEAKSRRRPEISSELRGEYQRDIDRIIHCKAFRRLAHKTQVFLDPEGDHYRTRLTHTMEVVRISRTIARALGYDEDLTEAIAWGHDLGHTPFGHAGEKVLNSVAPGGFRHNEQSLRVVDILEKDGDGLNLTQAVRDGILNHNDGGTPQTPEGKTVHAADRIAYICHDTDDALRAGIIKGLPPEFELVIGESYSERINSIVTDLVKNSLGGSELKFSPEMFFVVSSFREFLFSEVYMNPIAKSEESKVAGILTKLYEYYTADGLDEREATDFIAGMTDRFAVRTFEELFIPKSWALVQ
ncbi:MAG: deoxyguanosinetriphosphate triphosphohydrolase [Oscillospiraceae bacterium]|jgi:dGTPase|nr:deoxyguanosinetriphosphate triphosphohydrolase [Oscillospiraceae bacterium]